MPSARYLINFSYLGHAFRGSQRQVSRQNLILQNDPTTVQGRMEMGLQFLQPINDPVVYMASRTDAGVHALNTTCHVDLTKSDNSIYEPTVITSWLNTYFYREAVPIRVLGAKNVSDDFNCKSAISRTYLYRILLAKLKGHSGGLSTVYIPIEELNRCHFIGAHEFDINIMRQAAKMFEGFHDFRTFMGKTKDDDRITRRSIDSVIIIERNFKDLGVSSTFSWPESVLNNIGSDTYTYLDIYFKGKGFLYKQVLIL